MKPQYFLFCIVLVGVTLACAAQPFVQPVYSARVERNVVYGTAESFRGTIDTLRMNIWKPVGDGSTSRPLFVWIHGGGFTQGNRNEMDATCEQFAKRGYVAATITYRLGFYTPPLLDYPFTYDSAEVIRACIRGVQDAHGAIRFLASRAAIDSSNPSALFVGGASAGAIVAMQAVYGTRESDVPKQILELGDVVREVYKSKRPNLGSLYGTLHPNTPEPKPIACVSLLGGVWDVQIFHGELAVPLFVHHQTGDPVVPCSYQRCLWGFPFGISDNYPKFHGSCSITNYLRQLDIQQSQFVSQIIDGNIHDVFNYAQLVTDVVEFCGVRAEATSINEFEAFVEQEWKITDITGRVFRAGKSTQQQARSEIYNLPQAPYILQFGSTTELLTK